MRTGRVRACEELGQTASRANAEEVLVQCHCRHHHYGLRFYKSRLNTTIPTGAVCKRNLSLTEHQPGRCQPHAWHSTHLHLILSTLHPGLVCSGGRTVTSGSDLDSGTHTSTRSCTTLGRSLKMPCLYTRNHTSTMLGLRRGPLKDQHFYKATEAQRG